MVAGAGAELEVGREVAIRRSTSAGLSAICRPMHDGQKQRPLHGNPAATFGPYAENLRHVLARIEGHFLAGYADGGDMPDKQLTLVPGALADATEVLAASPATQARFARVADLVEGFETPFGMELLATVHWVATREQAADPHAAMGLIYGWNQRKRMFSPRQIEIAWSTLVEKGWLAGEGATNLAAEIPG